MDITTKLSNANSQLHKNEIQFQIALYNPFTHLADSRWYNINFTVKLDILDKLSDTHNDTDYVFHLSWINDADSRTLFTIFNNIMSGICLAIGFKEINKSVFSINKNRLGYTKTVDVGIKSETDVVNEAKQLFNLLEDDLKSQLEFCLKAKGFSIK